MNVTPCVLQQLPCRNVSLLCPLIQNKHDKGCPPPHLLPNALWSHSWQHVHRQWRYAPPIIVIMPIHVVLSGSNTLPPNSLFCCVWEHKNRKRLLLRSWWLEGNQVGESTGCREDIELRPLIKTTPLLAKRTQGVSKPTMTLCRGEGRWGEGGGAP